MRQPSKVGPNGRENRWLYVIFTTIVILIIVTLFRLQTTFNPVVPYTTTVTGSKSDPTEFNKAVAVDNTTVHPVVLDVEGDGGGEDNDGIDIHEDNREDVLLETPQTKPTIAAEVKYPFCPRCSKGDTICQEFGDLVLRRSVGYEGTSRRLQEKLIRAMEGKPTKIAIMGGSVSTGHTLKNLNDTFHARTFEWWNKQFPHSGNLIVNGAKAATQSSYFAFCYAEHIPTDADIVLLEFSVNDGSPFPNPEGAGDAGDVMAMEWLIRSLLRLPSKPAVILLSLFSFKAGEYFNGQESHLPVVNYYDIPYISMKNAFYDYANRYPDVRPILYNDGHHLSTEGHRVAAELMIHHIQRQICAIDRGELRESENTLNPGRFPLPADTDLPMVDMWTPRMGNKHFREFEPRCYTFAITVTGQQAAYRPSVMQGWEFWNWKKEKYYVLASEPGALITFPVQVTQGRVYMTIFKSAMYELGDVWCWTDEAKAAGKQLAGYWDSTHNIGETVSLFEGLEQGEHEVHCELLPAERSSHPKKGTNFRILAVVTG